MRRLIITTAVSGMVLAGCATTNSTTPINKGHYNKTIAGALMGAAGAGALSSATGRTSTGRDAAMGALLGAGIGYYMDQQTQQLNQQMAGTGVSVKQNPQTGNIDLVMPGNITFAFDDAKINPIFMQTLDKIAATLNQYHETTIVLVGHTDSTGNYNYNMDLSYRRAQAVANYLVDRGIPSYRIQVKGLGSSQPIASNSTALGQAKNRRVEMTILAPQGR